MFLFEFGRAEALDDATDIVEGDLREPQDESGLTWVGVEIRLFSTSCEALKVVLPGLQDCGLIRDWNCGVDTGS